MGTIICDADDSTADFTPKFCEFHNDIYGTNLAIKDFTTYSYPKVLGCSRDEARKKVDRFYESDYFNEIMPLPGSVKAIERLSEILEFRIATHRSIEKKNQTYDFYDKYFNGLITDIYFAKGCYNPSSMTKVEFISSNGTLFAIDDIFDIALRIKDSGVDAIVFKRPWNENKDYPTGIHLKKDWYKIESFLSNQQIYK